MSRTSGVWDASDEALLAGMAGGDRDAALAFVRRFRPRVYGLARTIVNDPHVAEDIAQEAFLRAWRSAATFDVRRGTVAAWLGTITRNLAVDALRLRRADPVDPDELAAALVTSAGGPPEAAERADDVARVRAAVAALPAPQRRAVLLSTFLGRTAAEIAELEGIPLGTAKTRIRTGLLRLQAAPTLRRADLDEELR
jgi:RNA polymerase sigma-70 factor (ECF subfamily)